MGLALPAAPPYNAAGTPVIVTLVPPTVVAPETTPELLIDKPPASETLTITFAAGWELGKDTSLAIAIKPPTAVTAPATWSATALEVGIDETLSSGKILKNYNEQDFNILED